MKIKIISFALVVLMLMGVMSMAAAATAETSVGIMCLDYKNHEEYWHYCPDCNAYVCLKCYPDHANITAVVCPIHNMYHTYCATCKYHHCPDPSHHITAPQYGYCTKHTTLVAYVYCSYCLSYYCPACNSGYHNHSGIGNSVKPFVCAVHNKMVSYCETCKYFYCDSCHPGSHNHTGSPSVTAPKCDSPKADVKNASTVEYGTKLTLTTETPSANIYYTTDGTVPTIYSARYTTPITLTKNTTINAIAVKYGMVNSSTSTYKFYVREQISFSDVSGYPGLSNALSVLVDNDIIADESTFNPGGGFTFAELKSWLDNMNVSFDKVTGVDHIDEDENLTYNDFVYVLYKALLKADLIDSPKGSGYATLKKFTYGSDITNASFYKAGFVAFYENGLFYDINFKPDTEATRVYLATALAAVINNN